MIEKKVDKETDSSKSKDHISHAKKEEYRSVGRHHHHPPRHLVRREGSSPSLSPIKKHKEEFLEWMNYKGRWERSNLLPLMVSTWNMRMQRPWLFGMKKYFQLHNYSS
jgi:hypothetical protein